MSKQLLIAALIPFGAAVILGSCARKDDTPPPTPEPPPSKMDISGVITAKGADPSWTLTIDGTTLTLKRDGEADVVATSEGATIQPGQAQWQAISPDNYVFTVTLYSSFCDDNPEQKQMPYTAEVDVTTDVLHGCATKVSGPARPAAPAAKTS